MSVDAQLTATVQALGKNFADAFNRGDFAAIGALHRADAQLLPPGAALVTGQANIQLFWGRSRRIQEIQLEPITLKKLGEKAIRESGILHLRLLGNGPRRMQAKYVLLWQQDDEGWKLDTMIWNRGEPAPGQARGQMGGQGQARQGSRAQGSRGQGQTGPAQRGQRARGQDARGQDSWVQEGGGLRQGNFPRGRFGGGPNAGQGGAGQGGAGQGGAGQWGAGQMGRRGPGGKQEPNPPPFVPRIDDDTGSN